LGPTFSSKYNVLCNDAAYPPPKLRAEREINLGAKTTSENHAG
jgi:hypothetical protein